MTLSLLLLLAAAAVSIYVLLQSRGTALLAWAVLALAVVHLL